MGVINKGFILQKGAEPVIPTEHHATTQEEPVSLTGREIDDAMKELVRNAMTKELSTTEYHIPTMNYMGPGTHVISNVFTNKQPVNTFDKASMIHDVEYVKPGNQWSADNNMWLNLVKEAPYLLPVHNLVRAAFLVKDLFGYHPPTDQALYDYTKEKVKNTYDLGSMSFYDDGRSGIV